MEKPRVMNWPWRPRKSWRPAARWPTTWGRNWPSGCSVLPWMRRRKRPLPRAPTGFTRLPAPCWPTSRLNCTWPRRRRSARKCPRPLVLIARTNQGREVAPRLAFRLGVGLAQDCLEVSADAGTGKLLANRPVYGGNAVAVISCNQTPQVAAVRPKVYAPLEADASRAGEVVSFPVDLDASMVRSRVIEVVKEEAEGIKLEDASIVVSGGRGLGGPEPFSQLEELAKLLGGAVGASRAAVDSGWVPASYQVGLTGKTITPDLYITIAISGASQHMAGCSGSKAIVAINKDAEANIFKEARYGVVGDWEKVLAAMTETVRELVQE